MTTVGDLGHYRERDTCLYQAGVGVQDIPFFDFLTDLFGTLTYVHEISSFSPVLSRSPDQSHWDCPVRLSSMLAMQAEAGVAFSRSLKSLR